MTTIDWSQAGSNASASFDQKVQDAAGDIVLAIDDLMGDASVPRQAKLGVLMQLGAILTDRQQLQQLLSGQQMPSLGQLGSGSGGQSTGPSQQDLDNANDRADAAETQNRELLKDRRVLEQIVLDMGLNAPANSNTAFASDTPQKVKDKISEKERDAANAAGGNDRVEKSMLQPLVKDVKDAISGLDAPGVFGGHRAINGLDELNEATANLEQAVS